MLCFALQIVAILCFAFSMQKHRKHIPWLQGTSLSASILKKTGVGSLLLSVMAASAYNDVLSIALVWWFCTLSLAILCVALYCQHVAKVKKMRP